MTNFATGVAIASTRLDGVDHVVTVNSLTSVSLDPPLILISVGRTSRFSGPLRSAGVWGVSILGAEAGELALRCARRGGGEPPAGGLSDVAIHRGRTGVALLDESIARLECRTDAVHPAGDHDLVVGEVVATSVGRVGQTSPTGEGADRSMRPLVSHRKQFRTTT